MSAPHRYAIVGTGGRATMWVDAICDRFRESAQLVGLCDLSTTRMAWHNRRIGRAHGVDPVPEYAASAFDAMVADTRPDTVIVTTTDCDHDLYIVRAMELGCDAITEKPMTTEAEKAARILDAIDRTGRSLRVAFNYRYMPAFTKLRELIAEGAVGEPTLVDFSWMLDTSHGADYFRRWHGEKDKSGGLLVHKASHHFDLVNWWISGTPRTVMAMGNLAFYGRANATQRGERYNYDRYTGSVGAEDDPFALFLDRHRGLRGLYLDAEAESGYVRDRNVFGDHVTIEDTMAVTARYDNGVLLSYSLVAYSPWEGLRVAVTGTKGRVELFERHGSHIISGQSDAELAAAQALGREHHIWQFPMFSAPQQVEIPRAEGGHGGGDPVMLEQIFSPTAPPDPFGRAASHLDGAASVLLGVAANASMASGGAIDCAQLLALPAR
jgi:predicted dehydrogenase